MTDKKGPIGPTLEIQLKELAEEDSKGDGRLEIIRTGNFNHKWYGPFKVTKKMLKSFVKNFNQKTLGIDIMIDYDHKIEEAAAWVEKLSIEPREDGQVSLMADVSLTSEGKRKIKEKEFKYVSADFTENFVDNEGGEEHGPLLFGAALTNRPFVKGMSEAVALKEDNNNGGNNMNLEELKEENKQLKEKFSGVEKRLNDLEAKNTEKENEIKTLKEQNETLDKENKTLNAAKKETEKESQFEKLLSDGKAVPAQKEAWMAGDMIKFAELSGKTKLETEGKDGNEGDNTVDPQDKVLKLAQEKVTAKEVETVEDGISLVLRENVELRKQIYG